MKKKNWFLAACCLMLPLAFVGCSDDEEKDGPTIDPPMENAERGVFILNSGKWKSNNATLDYYSLVDEYYNLTGGKLETKVFSAANGRGLGDTANDMLVYGSKVYVAVDVSNTIEIMDLEANSLATISPKDADGQPQSPRNLAAYNGKVYVTLFDGHLAEIDTATMEITKQVAVGPNPYQVCPLNGKLYVANSGGYNPVQDSTLSVVDPVSFTEEKKIVVGLNPQTVCADAAGELYVMCGGNFADVKASVQRVNLEQGTSETILTNDNIMMAAGTDNRLMIIHSEKDENWQPVNTKFVQYDMTKDQVESDNFITDGTVVEKPYSLSVDNDMALIYIGTSDYTNTGDVFIFHKDGTLLTRLAVSGINPIAVRGVAR